MSRTSFAAPSTVITNVTTLALALVVALELGGAVAMSRAPDLAEAVAAADGATVDAPAAPRAPRVEISIVAQAETPIR